MSIHLELQRLYGFKFFQEIDNKSFYNWLVQKAIETRNNAELVGLFVQECHNRKVILPGITVIERLCADARVAAERKIVEQIFLRCNEELKDKMNVLLSDTIDGRLTIHGWLKRFEIGNNSADVSRLLDKLEYLQKLYISSSLLEGIPSHRVIWLRQQGEAYYASGLQDKPPAVGSLTLSIVAVYVVKCYIDI